MLEVMPILRSIVVFFFDYYSDLTLTRGYYLKSQSKASYTASYSGQKIDASADPMNTNELPAILPEDYSAAFNISVLCFVFPILLTVPITKEELARWDVLRKIPKRWRTLVLWLLALTLSPLTPLYACGGLLYTAYRHKGVSRKSAFRESLYRFEYLWGVIRTVEAGIESSGQLVLQVWLLSFQMPTLSGMNFYDYLQRVIKGVLFFITLTKIEASELDQSLGKLFMSFVTLVLGVTSCYQTLKRGAVSHSNTKFIAMALCFQILARIISLLGYFVALPRAYLLHCLVFILHFVVLGIFRAVVELRTLFCYQRRAHHWDTAIGVFLINVFASGLVFVRVKQFGQRDSSFFLHVGYWILAQVENIALVLVTVIVLMDLDLIWIIRMNIGLGISSALSYFIYYRCLGHPWKDINGPCGDPRANDMNFPGQ